MKREYQKPTTGVIRTTTARMIMDVSPYADLIGGGNLGGLLN